MTEAIRYALDRWSALVHYRDGGQPEIDNLIAGRTLGGVAPVTRNYSFVGADSRGEWCYCDV